MKALGSAVLAAMVALAALGVATPAAAQTQAGCQPGAAALEKGELGKARDAYLEALRVEGSSQCATAGLKEVTTKTHEEEKLCAQAGKLTESGETAEAHQLYVQALGLNTESKCATEGLGSPAEGKSTREEISDWSDLVPKVSLALGTAIVAFLVLLGFILVAYVAFKRLSSASLVIKPFADGALEKGKVGTAVAGLVEKELSDLAMRSEEADDGYQLDVIVANVELLAQDEELKDAVGGLADESHLKLVVAILSMIDRIFGRRNLVAEGELLPAGDEGEGLAVALYRHNELRARTVHWTGPPPPAPQAKTGLLKCKSKAPEPDEGSEPQDYYDLAVPASSWIQYEAARSLDSYVGFMTDSPESFGNLAAGLTYYRAGKIEPAKSAYEKAIDDDAENVAALVNLALLEARHRGEYEPAIKKLQTALSVLEKRYARAK